VRKDSHGLQRCESLDDVRSMSGRRAVLTGIYHQTDLRMRPKPPPVYAGYVAIRLRDGTHVNLEPNWSAAAIRNSEEVARYEGKLVEVIGVIHSEAPEPPEPVAYVTDPCISPVEAIRLSPRGDAR
jgi:hypothetical protein